MIRPLILTALLASALVGCTAVPPTAPAGDAPANTAQEAPAVSAIDEPCSVVERSELDDILDARFADGREIQTTATSNDIVWSPSRCRWEAEGGLEVTIDIADAAAFETGELVCIRPARFEDEITELPGLGDQAFWVSSDFFGAEGNLRICTADALIDIEIQAESGDPAALQKPATELTMCAVCQGTTDRTLLALLLLILPRREVMAMQILTSVAL